MKCTFYCILLLTSVCAWGQTDTLPSALFSWSKAPTKQSGTLTQRPVINGSTLDLKSLKVHTTTLAPGQRNHPPVAYTDQEELVIVKDGLLNVTINGTTTQLGAGGLAMIIAGDKQSVQNASDKPVIYYVLVFKGKEAVNIERGRKGGGSFVQDWKDYKVKQTDKGESRPIFDQPSSMFRRFEVHATALNPGFASHAAHTHRVEEIILMIKGTGEMQMCEVFHKAIPGDVMFVNSMVPHAIKNTGKEQCGYFAIQWHSNNQ
jgi:(S)-ureidoglycine aminohydrolase